VRAKVLCGEQRIGEIRSIPVDRELGLDPSAGLGPADDRVAIAFGQRGVGRDVVQSGAVGKQAPPLSPAWMLARERELFVVDHVIHRRQPASGYLGIRKTATRATRMPGL